MGKLIRQNFDYSVVDKDTKGKLIYYAGEIGRQGLTHAESGLSMGRMLSEARDLFEDKKSFELWVNQECGFSVRTAYNYMAAHDSFGSCANLAQIELSAMYELASNEDAKKAALKIAAKGGRVTYTMARELIEEAKAKSTGQSGGISRLSETRGVFPSEPIPSVGFNPFDDPDSDVETDPIDVEEPDPRSPKNGGEKPGDEDPFGDAPADPEPPDPQELARKNKALCNAYRDKLARAICDYHEVSPNRAERDRLVKLVQGVVLW